AGTTGAAVGAGDLHGGAFRGTVRRPTGPWRRRAGGRRGRPGRALVAAACSRARSTAGWPGAGSHGRLPGGGAGAQASGERLLQRGCLRGGGAALVVAVAG